MKLISNPIVIVVLGLVLGVGTSSALIWTTAKPLVRQIAESLASETKPARPEPPWDFWTIEVESLAKELKEQKAALKQREEGLAGRESRLKSEQQELEKTRRQIEALRSEIGSKMIEVQADEAKNLKTLAATYRNLSPKTAVAILREMDELTVVKVLSLMKTDEVSALFEEMAKSGDPALIKRAAHLSERIRLLKTVRPTETASISP